MFEKFGWGVMKDRVRNEEVCGELVWNRSWPVEWIRVY